MKVLRLLPSSEKGQQFFNVYARFAVSISLGILLAQLISGLTESGIIYNAIFDSMLVFGRITANISGILGAIIGVLLIELVGLRLFLPLSVDAFLYKRWQGLHLMMSIFIISMTLLLIAVSFMLSIDGKDNVINNVLDEVEQKERAIIDAAHEEELKELATSFQTDSTEIATRYSQLVTTKNKEAEGKLAVAQNDYDHWRGKKGNYSTRINRAESAMKQIEADAATAIAGLEEQKAKELLTIRNGRNHTRDSLQRNHQFALDQQQNELDGKKALFGSGGFWIVLLSICFSIVGVILQRIFRKGSEVKERTVSNWYFQNSIFSELYNTANDWIQSNTRHQIAKAQTAIPTPPLPQQPLPLFDESYYKQVVIKLKLEDISDENRTITIPAPDINVDIPRRKIGFHNENRKNENRSKGNLRTCEHCKKEYIYKHHKQKYCQDSCRIAAWEGRNGRKMEKK